MDTCSTTNKECGDGIREVGTRQSSSKTESAYPTIFVVPDKRGKEYFPSQNTAPIGHSNINKQIFVKPPIFAWTSATNLLKNRAINEHINVTKHRSNSSKPSLAIELEKPQSTLQKLRRTRIAANTTSQRPSVSQGSVRSGALEKTIFHGDEIGSENETGSRGSSSYGIRTLFSHLQASGVTVPHAVNQTHEMLEKGYTKEELRDYQQIFQMFDTDGSGALGKDELKEAMISIGLQSSEKEIEELIREVDEDGNGEIDFEEFCHCMKKSQNRVNRATNEEIARQCFEVFDQDGNGLITENEFIYVAKEIGGFSHELAEYVFHELDISSNGHLSSDQFSAIVEDYLLSNNKLS